MMALIWLGVLPDLGWAIPTLGYDGGVAAYLLYFSWDLNHALALICGVFVGGVYGDL